MKLAIQQPTPFPLSLNELLIALRRSGVDTSVAVADLDRLTHANDVMAQSLDAIDRRIGEINLQMANCKRIVYP